jgi:hypothetical protein
MGNINDTRIVLGSLRYKGSPNTDLSIQLGLEETQKQQVEYDRTPNINLEQVFQDERQASNKFRPTCKFSIIFKNAYSGQTIGNPPYPPFEQNLYYLNAQETVIQRCNPNSNFPWGGFPLYNEFDFIRNDYNVSGYTITSGSTPPHINFVAKSASSYNWNFFISYAFENDYNKQLQAIFKVPNDPTPLYPTVNWTVSDGIPFVIKNSTYNGRDIIQFRSPIKHGLSVGEFFQVSSNFRYTGSSVIDIHQVYSLGDDTFGSDEYVFNIVNIGFTGSTFNDGGQGTAKRLLLKDNVTDTISKYYIRRNKILTNIDDIVVTKTGFEQTAFRNVKKYEPANLTPNLTSRISVKEGSQAYSVTVNNILDINNLLDNQKRPISELFFTVMWKGYFGWTFGVNDSQTNNYYPMKQGWGFNIPSVNTNNIPNNWWDNNFSLSNTTFLFTDYQRIVNGNQYNFTYLDSLQKGDELDGDLCEWNDFEQKERVISRVYHKIKFNPNLFDINQSLETTNSNQRGYYYNPLHSMTIRVFSDYIENGDKRTVENIPNYSYFTTTNDQFIWRDLYPYGYVDSSGLGVDYPFLNGVHYPYNNFIFRIIPEGTNYIEQTITSEPITDPCE